MPVETLRLILLFVHILGFAALIGGLLVQATSSVKSVNGAMRDGSGTALLTGLALVGVLEAGDEDVNQWKIGLKLVIALVILVLVMRNLRRDHIPQGLWAGLLALTVINIGLAVFWTPAHT